MRLLKNSKGVSHVMGFVMMLMLTSTTMVSVLYVTNIQIDNTTKAAANLQAQNIANYVADAVMGGITTKRSMSDTYYETILDLPRDLAGRSYYVEITDSAVFVNSTDGGVSKNCTNYNAEEFAIGINGQASGSNGKIKIFCDKTTDIYKFDFGNDDVSDGSVESGYIRIGSENVFTDMPDNWMDEDWKHRIPMYFNNSVTKTSYMNNITAQNLTDFQYPVNFYPSIFNYDKAKADGSDIRFADDQGNELDYYIDYWNPYGNSKVWIKLGDISVNTTEKYYIYYGNENAVSKSNPVSVFEFYDDCDNMSKWFYSSTDELSEEDIDDSSNSVFNITCGNCAITSSFELECKTPYTNPPADHPYDSFIDYTLYMIESKIKLKIPRSAAVKNVDANVFALSQYAPPEPITPSGFPEGTSILMSDLSSKNIEDVDIVTPDSIKTSVSPKNGDVEHRYSYEPGFITDGYTITTNSGSVTLSKEQSLYCEYDVGVHPIIDYVRDWLAAKDITISDSILYYQGGTSTYEGVTSITHVTISDTVNSLVTEYTGDDNSYYANGYLAKGGTHPPSATEMCEESYIYSSQINPQDYNGFEMHKMGTYHEWVMGKTGWKESTTPTVDPRIGHGNQSMSDEWSLIRSGIFLGNSKNISDDSISSYVVLGGSRFNFTSLGDIGILNSVIFDESGNYTEIYDIPDGLTDVVGDPLTSGEIGLGCGVFNQSAECYTLVDWVRIWQSLIYNPNINFSYKGEESLNYGWDDFSNINIIDREEPNSDLVRDFHWSSQAGVFKIANLTTDTTYTITLTMGDNVESHNTMVEIFDGFATITPTVTESSSDSAGNFTSVSYAILATTGDIKIRFTDPTGSSKWKICSIMVEEGNKQIRISDST